MANFEARYRAIVEKRGELKHTHLDIPDGIWMHDDDQVSSHIARPAVCWWLAGKLKEHDLEGVYDAMMSDDPADAILTAWEIILGIKEGA